MSAQRAEIRDWSSEMAGLLAGEPSVAGWRDFLLCLADVLGDREIDEREALTESHIQVRRFYAGASRMTSDFVLYRPDRAEMSAANERLLDLRWKIEAALARAAGS